MATPEEHPTPTDGGSDSTQDYFQEPQELTTSTIEVPSTPRRLAAQPRPTGPPQTPRRVMTEPLTPGLSPAKRIPTTTPRIKKKVPWKGKNIMVLIPRDEERGKPGQAPLPLNETAVNGMLKSWEQLGYDIRGFDLDIPSGIHVIGEYSQSRGSWPDIEELARERSTGKYRVQLPDLNAWKEYVNELNEAKLRALGVSFGDEDPPPPSISPASTMSRQPSVTHYPPLPFSPPIPTSSASSNQVQGFPFQFGTSGAQSPGIPSTASPVPFPGKFNPRASISIPSPHGWSPQMMLQQQSMHRGGSPSLANFSALMSPTSPFSPDGMSGPPSHQRHQSLQYPMLPHQFQQPARASPRLQELREVDEEALPSKSPSKTPEPTTFVRHNASDSLQKEIDEAEYHLEEQMRSQLDNDRDYSPHNETEQAETNTAAEPVSTLSHARDPSVSFAPQPPRFGVAADGLTLHHPRPHSRGHSLSQKYFTEEDANKQNPFTGGTGFREGQGHVGEESEIETNPSHMGTPIQALDFSKLLHQRSFSTASNPWTDNESGRSAGARRLSHGSKPSLSGLNVEAPEFKFNPESSFKPAGQFVFGSNNFQPAVFNAGLPSANSSQFSLPTTASSKINVNAPSFSPGQSDFSFSASGPKFRPDAPAFNPFSHNLSDSVTSPLSGGESGSNRASSIFGNIDLSTTEFIKPVKKSKAIPIIRPVSSHRSPEEEEQAQEDPDGRDRIVDESRVKRARGYADNDDEIPRFAEPSEEATPVPESRPKAAEEAQAEEDEALQSEEKSFEEDNLGPADTTFSSTMVSETTDTKVSGSPVATSPDQGAIPWAPFEFNSNVDMASFNDARPFGEESFKRGHKKSLSATANAFVPGAGIWGTAADETVDESLPDEDAELVDITEPVQVQDELEMDTNEPAEDGIKVAVEEPIQQSVEPAEEPASTEAPVAASATQSKGLLSSRFAASPPPVASTPKGLAASRFAASSPPAPPRNLGLSASRFAASPSPVPDDDVDVVHSMVSPIDVEDITQQSLSVPTDSLPPVSPGVPEEQTELPEPSLADIDAVMRHFNQHPNMGVNRALDHQAQFQQPPQFEEEPQYHHPSPNRHIDLAAVTNSSPLHLPPQQHIFRSDAPSPSPGRSHPLQAERLEPMLSTELEDPFIDPPQSAMSHDGPGQPIGSEGVPASDWEGAFTDDEHTKLESRVNFFDGHVNGLVGNLLDARIAPLEDIMDDIKHLLTSTNRRTPSSRRDRRSISADIQHSDADDEDEEVPLRRSMSPRRDKRMEQMRAVLLDVMAQQQYLQPPLAPSAMETSGILKALEEMKEQFGQSLHLDFRGEDLRNIVEDAVERRMPPTPQPMAASANNEKVDELHARILDLEQRLQASEAKVDTEVSSRRAAEDQAVDLARKLEFAETRIEVEIMNKSAFDQRVADLDDRLHHQEEKTREELQGRREAEDRLSEIQRLLRISSEEETRLREMVEEKDLKIKSLESTHGKSSMRLALLESEHSNSQQSQNELQKRINMIESDLRDARQEARHYRSETERLTELTRRTDGELDQIRDENRSLRKVMETLSIQLEEHERVRDSWRSKFITLQQEMAHAAREITEETQRRAKKEQAWLAREEVLEARLQAEARTRERIETELERLEMGERQGMRAVSENKRLETLLGELRTENHNLQQASLRYQAEFQEARESAAREVQRTRDSMQGAIDDANHQVNIAREELEDQMSRLRSQLDQVKLDADTARARHDMLLEEAQSSKRADLEDLARKHQNELEDTQARFERQINNTTEDAQRSEQNLLERLSISNSKTEHLQDKVAHLEEKLDIAKEAARAAAQAARSTVVSPEPVVRAAPAPAAAPTPASATAAAVQLPQPKTTSALMQLPEKISPQALRESIMVLQEQLQDREQKIEELEAAIAKLDPDAEIKISKRDDEITWLRELLAVRHSDLQDIIAALGRDDYDKHRVKDAAIRLKANLQMEEQERERAMNGGSAINLPNIAASLRDATPRVAQAVGPLAAAWGNWRKGRDPNSFGSLSGVLASPGQGGDNNSTPSKSSPSQNSFLGGLLTPPASGLRQTPPGNEGPQTAFSATGRRFTAQDLANRPRPPSVSRAAGKMPARGSPSRSSSGPMTPPMMRPASYDADAHVEDFDDAGFFDDD